MSDVCRINFDCQQGQLQAENPVVSAARAVFQTSVPTFWTLTAMWTPSFFLPLVKFLACQFPTRVDAANNKANEYMFDVSATLIEVSFEVEEQILLVGTTQLSVIAKA